MADARETPRQNFRPNCERAVQTVQAFSGGGFRNANVQFLIAGPGSEEARGIFRQRSSKK